MVRLKTNYFNLSLRIFFGLILLGIILNEGAKIFFNSNSKTTDIYVLIFLILFYVMLILLSKMEPDFVIIEDGKIKFRSFPYFNERMVEIKSIKGFSLSNKTYSIKGGDGVREPITFSIYILYLPDRKKIHIIKYNFRDFNEIEKIFRKSGIKRLGYEKEKYGFLFRKYKYD